MLQTVRGSRWWQAAAAKPQNIAIVLFAVILTLLLINVFIVADDDAIGGSPTSEAPESVTADSPVENGTGRTAGLIAGFGLLGGWAVLGVFTFTKPTRDKRARERLAEPES